MSSRRPTCPRCKHPGFRQSTAHDGRPKFTCDSCGNEWTNGKDGGEYVQWRMGYLHAPRKDDDHD